MFVTHVCHTCLSHMFATHVPCFLCFSFFFCVCAPLLCFVFAWNKIRWFYDCCLVNDQILGCHGCLTCKIVRIFVWQLWLLIMISSEKREFRILNSSLIWVSQWFMRRGWNNRRTGILANATCGCSMANPNSCPHKARDGSVHKKTCGSTGTWAIPMWAKGY